MGVYKSRRPIIAPNYTDTQLPSSLAATSNVLPAEYVFVTEKADLPTAVTGVITLSDMYTYHFTTTVDLTGDRIQLGENTVIVGSSSENALIKSTGLSASTALITGAYSFPLRNIAITHGTALDLVAFDGDQSIDWLAVNFVGCATIGTIDGYSNAIFNDCAILDSANWTFEGATGTIAFNNCLFVGLAAQSTVILGATLNITRRFRVVYSAAVAFGAGTAFEVNVAATIPVEGFIMDTVNFSGGATYTSGIVYTDNEALFVNNVGVTNSADVAHYTMNGNATVTTIGVINTPVKAAGTTVNDTITQKFTNTDNRATYEGAITRDFHVQAIVSLESGNNKQIGTFIAKNGAAIATSNAVTTTSGTGKDDNIIVQAVVELAATDYLEVFVENESDTTDITVTSINLLAEAIN